MAWLVSVTLGGTLVGTLAGCGFPRPQDLPISDGAIDTRIDTAIVDDAPAPAPRCSRTGRFTTVMPLASLNAIGSVGAAHPSSDELTLWFSGLLPGGAGGADIYQASRTLTSLPYGDVAPVPGVNTGGDESHPHMRPDGLWIFGDSTPPGAPTGHIALATRTTTAVDFGPLQALARVNSTAIDSDLYVLPGEDVLYFTSNRTGKYALYRSARVGGAFSEAALVRGVDLDAADDKGNPVVTPDELTLFFYSNRENSSRFDAYQARRSTTADDFSTPRALDELNSSDSSTAPSWISADDCVLYFTRATPNVGGQIYVAVREK
jgi:hypothetical protein